MPKFRSKADVRGFQMRSPFHAVRAGKTNIPVPAQSEDTTDPIDEAAAYEDLLLLEKCMISVRRKNMLNKCSMAMLKIKLIFKNKNYGI